MAKQPAPKRLRLRRTIATAAGPSLSRSLWGVAAADARTALAAQQEQFITETAAVDAELKAERTRVEQLTQEVERQKRRLDSLRKVVEVLRLKLAHERAARAVLATRLQERPLEDEKAAGSSRLESIRLSADIQQEHEALRQLVAALYRSIAGRQGVPTGLDVLAQIPAAGSRAATVRPSAPWHRFLLGKKAGHALHAPNGRVILQAGETIGPDELELAEQEGLLFELILTARVVERLPEL